MRSQKLRTLRRRCGLLGRSSVKMPAIFLLVSIHSRIHLCRLKRRRQDKRLQLPWHCADLQRSACQFRWPEVRFNMRDGVGLLQPTVDADCEHLGLGGHVPEPGYESFVDTIFSWLQSPE